MKAIEQYFPAVLFIMLYKLVLTFESVDKILKCDHSNESYWAVPSCGTVYYAVQDGSNFWHCDWNPLAWPFKWKLTEQYHSPVVVFFMLLKVVLSFSEAIQIKATEQYVSVVLFLKLCKVALSFESVDCGVIIQMTGSCAGIAYYALQVFPKTFSSMYDTVLPLKWA